jgi:hypothetical protein
MDVALMVLVMCFPLVLAGIGIAFMEIVKARWRFSLRTLFVATTLVAAAFGSLGAINYIATQLAR